MPKLSASRKATPRASPVIASSSRIASIGSKSALTRRPSQCLSRRSTFSATAGSAMSSTKTVIFGASGSSPFETRPIASVPHIRPPWSVRSISLSGLRYSLSARRASSAPSADRLAERSVRSSSPLAVSSIVKRNPSRRPR